MNEQKPTKDTKPERGSATRSSSFPSRASVPSSPPQLLLFADVLPNGQGGFTVRPVKPQQEIRTVDAAKLLGVSRAQMWYLRNQPLGQRILRWRFISEKKGKILWDLDSVLAYKEATRSIED